MAKQPVMRYSCLVKWCYSLFAISVLLWAISSVVPTQWACQPYIQKAACIFALGIWLNIIRLGLFRRMTLDRMIADSAFPVTISVVLSIVAVPILIFGIINYGLNRAALDALQPVELIHSQELYYSHSDDAVMAHSDPDGKIVVEEDAHVQKYKHEREHCSHTEPGLMWTILYHFTDPGNQHMSTTHQGRRWALIIAWLGVLLMSGILVSTVTNFLSRRADDWTKGECRYQPYCFGFLRRWPLPRKVDKWLNRWAYRLFFGRYSIIIGGHQSAIDICRLIQNHRKGDKDYVNRIFILTVNDVPTLRNELGSAEGVNEEAIIIYKGRRTDEQAIRDLHVDYAHEIYILGESGDDPYHDVQNMACLQLVADKLKYTKSDYLQLDKIDEKVDKDERCEQLRRAYYDEGVTRCYVQLEYQTAFSVLQSSNAQGVVNNRLEFMPFSYYENWAQKVLITDADPMMLIGDKERRVQYYKMRDEHHKRRYLYAPIDGTGIHYNSNRTVHLVIVGMSKMGIAMAMEAAHIAHYPNFVRDHTLRTRITFIDTRADVEMEYFMSRFKSLFSLSRWRYDAAKEEGRGKYFRNEGCDAELFGSVAWNDPLQPGSPNYNPEAYYACQDHLASESNFIDIEWEFIKGGVEAPDVQRYLAAVADADAQRQSLLTVAVCLPQEHEALAAALYLPQQVYKNCVQILVYQRHGSSVVDDMSGRDDVAAICTGDSRKDAEDFFKQLRYKKLHPFGMLNYGDMRRLSYQVIAHRGARIYDAMSAAKPDAEVWKEQPLTWIAQYCDRADNDRRRLEWSTMKIWEKWSNIYNVNTLATKIRSMVNMPEVLAQNDTNKLDEAIETLFSVLQPKIRGGNYRLEYQADSTANQPLLLREKMMKVDLQTPDAALSDEQRQLRRLRVMSEVEHNRWNVEKLLMGYRPLSVQECGELFDWCDDTYVMKNKPLLKEYKNGSRRAHHCICSFERLLHVDPGTIDFDIAFTLMFSYLYRIETKR